MKNALTILGLMATLGCSSTEELPSLADYLPTASMSYLDIISQEKVVLPEYIPEWTAEQLENLGVPIDSVHFIDDSIRRLTNWWIVRINGHSEDFETRWYLDDLNGDGIFERNFVSTIYRSGKRVELIEDFDGDGNPERTAVVIGNDSEIFERYLDLDGDFVTDVMGRYLPHEHCTRGEKVKWDTDLDGTVDEVWSMRMDEDCKQEHGSKYAVVWDIDVDADGAYDLKEESPFDRLERK